MGDYDDKRKNLLGNSENDIKSIANLYKNFIIMCIAFSLNHGAVVSCLAYATAQLGNDLGGYGSGTLYIFYSITALLFSKPIVSMVGPKKGLILGVGGYCVYVAGFLFAIMVPDASWPVFLVSCAIGGTAGGLLWTAQGKYFSLNSKLYAESINENNDITNSTFAGIFATSYLGCEMITKVLATIIFLQFPDSAPFIIFTIYTTISVCATFVMLGLNDLNDKGTSDFSGKAIIANVGSVVSLVVSDNKLALMIPFQIAFGFASSYVPFYIFGTVIGDSDSLGGTYIGLLSAIIVLTGAIIAIPASKVANKFGKEIVMVIGGLCISLAGFVLYFVSDKQLGTWSLIIPFLIIYGIGRGTWENTNKAVIADLFADKSEFVATAFASVAFSNGFSGSIGYFTFANLDRLTMASIVGISSLLGVICYLISSYLHKSENEFL